MTDAFEQLFAWPAEAWLPALFLLISVILFRARGHAPGRFTFMLLGVACLVGVLLPLAGFWLAGRTHPNAVAGLLPWNDAAGYYGCAHLLLDGDNISPFCQRRPAYLLYLGGLIRAGGGALQAALLLQTVLNGAAILATALFVARRWGLASAFVAVAILSAYVAIFSITTLTESLGFVLGTAGLLLLLVGAERPLRPVFIAGVFLLSVALNARAGAFFVLPVLMAWPFLATGAAAEQRWRTSAFIGLAGLAGFVPGTVAAGFLGDGVGEVHSNFAYILYGIAAGGKRWLYALEQLPGASTDEISAAAWELIRTQPHIFVLGLIQGFLEYLQRLLSYIPWLPARIVLAVLWLWGLGALFVRRASSIRRVLALTMFGIVASSPFMSIDGDTRVYATTMAIDGILAALGFRLLVDRSTGGRKPIWAAGVVSLFILAGLFAPEDPRAWGLAMVGGGVLAWLGQFTDDTVLPPTPRSSVDWGVPLGLTAIVLMLAGMTAWPDPRSHPGLDIAAARSTCGQDSPLVIRPGRGSPVARIDPAPAIWPITIPVEKFRAGLHPLTHGHGELSALPDGTAVVYAYDLLGAGKGSSSVLLGDSRLLPKDGGRYLVCVTPVAGSVSLEARRITAIHPIDERRTGNGPKPNRSNP